MTDLPDYLQGIDLVYLGDVARGETHDPARMGLIHRAESAGELPDDLLRCLAANREPDDGTANPAVPTKARQTGLDDGVKRSWVKYDRYALFDLGRQHRLSDRARWMLVVLCNLADYRTRSWTGTTSDLSNYTGTGRNTVPKVLAQLDAAGLVKIARPFGPNREGEVELLAWDELIVCNSGRGIAQNRANESRGTADQSHSNRAAIAQDSAVHQRKGPIARTRGSEVVVSDESRTRRGSSEDDLEEVVLSKDEHRVLVSAVLDAFPGSTVVYDGAARFAP